MSERAGARRELGLWMATAMVVGNIIGMGIFMQPAALAPYGFNALLAWGITVAGCAALALVFAMLVRRLPEADGPLEYLRATLGEDINLEAAEDGLARLVALGLLDEEAEGGLVLHRLRAAFVQGLAADAEAQTAVEETLYAEANRLNRSKNFDEGTG